VPRLQRAAEISAEQVGAVRKRWLVEQFQDHKRVGALWAINTRIEDFNSPESKGYADPERQLFPQIRTDLNAFTKGEIACLENHGYSVADAAMRTFARPLCVHANAAFIWPDPDWVAGSQVQLALADSGSRGILRDVLRSILGP